MYIYLRFLRKDRWSQRFYTWNDQTLVYWLFYVNEDKGKAIVIMDNKEYVQRLPTRIDQTDEKKLSRNAKVPLANFQLCECPIQPFHQSGAYKAQQARQLRN